MTLIDTGNHRQILKLAVPMIIANISTPLLGLVDTAVMGHMDSEDYLGAVSLGGLIFSFVFWGFSFLRMGTTGITAQAFGNHDQIEVRYALLRALFIAAMIATALLFLQYPVREISFWLIDSSSAIEQLSASYFNIRIWSAPATLGLYVLLGWYLGLQDARTPLLIVIATNLFNIVLDLFFVVYLGLAIKGVALASVIAEYSGFLLGLLMLRRHMKSWPPGIDKRLLFARDHLHKLLKINNDIFVRTLFLIFAFAFFTAQGARLGEIILAANAVLLNFQMFMAFALDGFAHAVEALAGRAYGSADRKLFNRSIQGTAYWSIFLALAFTVAYVNFGEQIIRQLTSLENVRETAYLYLPWVIITPLLAFGCYLLDGVFTGLTLSRSMRNTMLFSVFCCFLPAWYWTRELHNHGLWLSINIFMVARSLSMAWVFQHKTARLFQPGG